jgi:hypothetical protein
MAILEMKCFANNNLDDFLHRFPDHPQAQQTKQLLQGTIDCTQPRTV